MMNFADGVHGQDPKRLFHHYDRDNSGKIDLLEFTSGNFQIETMI